MTIGDDGMATICMGKPHVGDPCKKCGHASGRANKRIAYPVHKEMAYHAHKIVDANGVDIVLDPTGEYIDEVIERLNKPATPSHGYYH